MGAIGRGMALSLLLAACTDFAHGVADKPLPNDPRLIGQWQSAEGRGLLFISAAGPARLRVDAYDAPACDHAEHFLLSRARIDGCDFVDVVAVGHEEGPRTIFGYGGDGPGRLDFYRVDDKVFTRAIAQGELPGQLPPPDEMGSIHVLASTAQLRHFLAVHPEAMGGKSLSLIEVDPAPRPDCPN